MFLLSVAFRHYGYKLNYLTYTRNLLLNCEDKIGNNVLLVQIFLYLTLHTPHLHIHLDNNGVIITFFHFHYNVFVIS